MIYIAGISYGSDLASKSSGIVLVYTIRDFLTLLSKMGES